MDCEAEGGCQVISACIGIALGLLIAIFVQLCNVLDELRKLNAREGARG